jgi:hypothetical protein
MANTHSRTSSVTADTPVNLHIRFGARNKRSKEPIIGLFCAPIERSHAAPAWLKLLSESFFPRLNSAFPAVRNGRL